MRWDFWELGGLYVGSKLKGWVGGNWMWGRNFSLTTLHRSFYTSCYKRVKKFHLEIEGVREAAVIKSSHFLDPTHLAERYSCFCKKPWIWDMIKQTQNINYNLNLNYHSAFSSSVFREISMHSRCVFSLLFFQTSPPLLAARWWPASTAARSAWPGQSRRRRTGRRQSRDTSSLRGEFFLFRKSKNLQKIVFLMFGK